MELLDPEDIYLSADDERDEARDSDSISDGVVSSAEDSDDSLIDKKCLLIRSESKSEREREVPVSRYLQIEVGEV